MHVLHNIASKYFNTKRHFLFIFGEAILACDWILRKTYGIYFGHVKFQLISLIAIKCKSIASSDGVAT